MNTKAFTLIELLIVVAIIAILAAIAVPNFLEAQTRAKVSRGYADMRSVATALETYAVDNSKYPYDVDSRGYPWYLTDNMTTPISYMTNASLMKDLFREGSPGLPVNPIQRMIALRYRYLNNMSTLQGWSASSLPRTAYAAPVPRGAWAPSVPNGGVSRSDFDESMELFGQWKMSSAGPDKTATDFIKGRNFYNATNGTVSSGDIIISQKGLKQ